MSCDVAPDPYYQEGDYVWSENLSHLAVFAKAVDDEGFITLITDHRVRARGNRSHTENMSMDNLKTERNQPCLFHTGRMSIDANGFTLPWMCGGDMSGSGGDNRVFVTMLKTTKDLKGLLVDAGYFHGPRWTEVRYYSKDLVCGAEFH